MRYLLICLTFLFSEKLSHASDNIEFYYEEYEPYLTSSSSGELAGNVGTWLRNSLLEHGVKATYTKASFKRIFSQLNNSKNYSCAIGYSKKPDRLKLYKFTSPFYYLGPYVVFANGDRSETISKFSTLKSLINESNLVGAFHTDDQWPALFNDDIVSKPNVLFAAMDDWNFAKLVANDRVDYVLLDEKAAFVYRDRLKDSKFIAIHYFPEIAERIELSIMCTKNITDTLIQSIESAISKSKFIN